MSYESYSDDEEVVAVKPATEPVKRAFAKKEPKKEDKNAKKGGKQQTSLLSYFQKK